MCEFWAVIPISKNNMILTKLIAEISEVAKKTTQTEMQTYLE